MENNQNNGAGKGDKPRNCFSQEYRDNYDFIFKKTEKEEQSNEKSTNDNASSSRGLSKFK
jgi:hypothetical protein